MNRRHACLVALGACACSQPAGPQLRIGISTGENQADRFTRYEGLPEYLGRAVQAQASLRQATDYASVIEALKGGKVELAYFGPASYAKAWLLTNGQVEPLCAIYDRSGKIGTASIIVVRSDSPARKLEDLRGKLLAMPDPNSTTGYQLPTFYLRREGKEPARFFGKIVTSGSHENGIVGLMRGDYDAATTWWTSEALNNLQRMIVKKMISRNSVRIVWQSPPLASSPWTVPLGLRSDWKVNLKKALLRLPGQESTIWRQMTDGSAGGLREVTHADYRDVIAMVQENEGNRKTGA